MNNYRFPRTLKEAFGPYAEWHTEDDFTGDEFGALACFVIMVALLVAALFI